MMSEKIQKFRFLKEYLPSSEKKRLVILTGARQTGKTTLARANYPQLRYINLDSLENRQAIRTIPVGSWSEVAVKLKKEWRGGLIIYLGNEIRSVSDALDIWAVPSRRLFII